MSVDAPPVGPGPGARSMSLARATWRSTTQSSTLTRCAREIATRTEARATAPGTPRRTNARCRRSARHPPTGRRAFPTAGRHTRCAPLAGGGEWRTCTLSSFRTTSSTTTRAGGRRRSRPSTARSRATPPRPGYAPPPPSPVGARNCRSASRRRAHRASKPAARAPRALKVGWGHTASSRSAPSASATARATGDATADSAGARYASVQKLQGHR